MRKRKAIALILICICLFCISSPTFAYTTGYIGTNPDLYPFYVHNVQREYTGFSVSSGYMISPSSSSKLTVRAYTETENGGHVRISNAKTYKAGSLSGGTSYWFLPDLICIAASGDSPNDIVGIYGTWTF